MDDDTNSERGRKRTPERIGAVIGWVVALVAARTLGSDVFIPIIGVVLIWALLARLRRPVAAFRGSVAIQLGHGLFMGWGLAVTAQSLLTASLVEPALLVCGAVWLMFRPGLVAVVVLCLYQVAAVGLNVYALTQQPDGSPYVAHLIIHILLRLSASVLMIRGLHVMRRRAANAPREAHVDG